MNAKRWLMIVLSFLLLATMLLTLGCNKPKTEEGSSPSEGEIDLSIDEGSEESEETSDTSEETETDEDEEPGEEITEPTFFSYAETHAYPPLSSLDEFTTRIGLSDEDKQNLSIHIDVEGNNVWGGKPEDIPQGYQGFTDIVFSARGSIAYESDYTGPPVNALFTCGYANPDVPLWVVCPPMLNMEDTNNWYLLALGLLDNTPFAHESNFGTITAALDSDANPENNWVALPEYPNDYYQGTDLWFTNMYDPSTGWRGGAFDADWNDANIYFITVFYKNIVVFFIPVDEIPAPNPGGRGTVMWTDHKWSLESYGGDVELGDPTLPPVPWGPGSLANFTSDRGGAVILPEGYTFCSFSGCNFNLDDPEFDDLNVMGSCECSGCTMNPGCDCFLFTERSPRDRYPPYTFSDPMYLDFVAGPNQKTLLDYQLNYNCLCVNEGQ